MSGPVDLAAVQARADAATPGPWEAIGDLEMRRRYPGIYPQDIPAGSGVYAVGLDRSTLYGGRKPPRDEAVIVRCSGDSDADYLLDDPDANVEFIAAARTDVPALVARVRELEARLAAQEQRIVVLADAEERVRDLEAALRAISDLRPEPIHSCASPGCHACLARRALAGR